MAVKCAAPPQKNVHWAYEKSRNITNCPRFIIEHVTSQNVKTNMFVEEGAAVSSSPKPRTYSIYCDLWLIWADHWIIIDEKTNHTLHFLPSSLFYRHKRRPIHPFEEFYRILSTIIASRHNKIKGNCFLLSNEQRSYKLRTHNPTLSFMQNNAFSFLEPYIRMVV